MVGLTLFLGLLIIVSVLFWRLRLSHIRTVEEANAAVLPGALLGGLLIICGLVFWVLALQRSNLAGLPLRRSMDDIEASRNVLRIVVEATVSEDNVVLKETYVAYIEYGDDSSYRHTPEITLDLTDDQIVLDNNTYLDRNWHDTRDGSYAVYYLEAGDPVIVVGDVVGYVTLAGDRGLELRAEQVFLGSHDEFAAIQRRSALYPSMMRFVAFGAGALIAALTIGVWVIRIRRGDLPGEITDPEKSESDGG